MSVVLMVTDRPEGRLCQGIREQVKPGFDVLLFKNMPDALGEGRDRGNPVAAVIIEFASGEGEEPERSQVARLIEVVRSQPGFESAQLICIVPTLEARSRIVDQMGDIAGVTFHALEPFLNLIPELF